MTTDPTSPNPDSEFSENALNHVFDLWVSPELERRQIGLSREGVRKVIVELEPGHPPRVLINEEAEIVATARGKRDLEEGEKVSLDDIEELIQLEPATIGANSGWVCFARVDAHEYLAFDFRYNKSRATALLQRAEEFLAAARRAASKNSLNVAIDTAHSAAELTVQAQMLTQQNETRSHRERREWLRNWADHQNSPRQHADILWNLADLRDQARYGSTLVPLKPGRMSQILSTVQEMIEQTSLRVADRNSSG